MAADIDGRSIAIVVEIVVATDIVVLDHVAAACDPVNFLVETYISTIFKVGETLLLTLFVNYSSGIIIHLQLFTKSAMTVLITTYIFMS